MSTISIKSTRSSCVSPILGKGRMVPSLPPPPLVGEPTVTKPFPCSKMCSKMDLKYYKVTLKFIKHVKCALQWFYSHIIFYAQNHMHPNQMVFSIDSNKTIKSNQIVLKDMHFTNFYRSNRPLLFDAKKRYSDEEIFARIRVHMNRRIFFHFDDNLCVPVHNEDELGICSRMYSIWHNSMLENENNNLLNGYLNGYLRSSHDIFHLPDNHFQCSLFPNPVSRTIAETVAEPRIIIEGIEEEENEIIPSEPQTDLQDDFISVDEEPDWCAKILDDHHTQAETQFMIDINESSNNSMEEEEEEDEDTKGIEDLQLIEKTCKKNDRVKKQPPRKGTGVRKGKYSI